MGIPVGWNIVRDQAKATKDKEKEKDVLRADLSGRSPIRRRPTRARNGGGGAFDVAAALDGDGDGDGDNHSGRGSRLDEILERASRIPPHAPAARRPPAPPVPELRAELRGLPALTPGFAPARPRAVSPDDDEPQYLEPQHLNALIPSWASARRHALRRISNPDADAADDHDEDHHQDDTPTTTTTTTTAVTHPPLRRVGHRTIADGPLPASSLRESWSPVSTLDGLGDRERSNSVSSTSSHLPWQTFLSTVVPDPVPPTAESSFASAAASASFTASSSRASSSNSNSAASDRTHLTVPSLRAASRPRTRHDVTDSFARACESDDDGDPTASDTDDEAAANPLSRRRMRPSYFADAPPSPRRHGRRVMDTGTDARRYVGSFFSHDYDLPAPRHTQVDGPLDSFTTVDDTPLDQPVDSFTTVDEDTQHASPLDQELRDARSLLERLTRRGDISDDFWASVGLTRSFTDGIERVAESGR